MSNDIKTDAGRTVGQRSGESAEELQVDLARIREGLRAENSRERLLAREMPHRKQLAEDLHSSRRITSGAATTAVTAWWERTPTGSSRSTRCGPSLRSTTTEAW